jgi:hypothetical protein
MDMLNATLVAVVTHVEVGCSSLCAVVPVPVIVALGRGLFDVCLLQCRIASAKGTV